MFALYFARGFQTFGYFVVMLREMILGDLARFIVIYLVALIGFAVGASLTDALSTCGRADRLLC